MKILFTIFERLLYVGVNFFTVCGFLGLFLYFTDQLEATDGDIGKFIFFCTVTLFLGIVSFIFEVLKEVIE
ncbi:hypothetical protein SAMN05192533_102291 [Mesobacillus persicus]|uniref:Uncharacterized protein n=1 Tax=Mesobacillus persicus TaxID=930146 RepID=A0A1H7XNH1_9BACI|nr:hypothetical protein [Mesobacillus persicus]SEM35330.1 hypothetical protein SAMN05192533_102291 [Mesobacillus persicus]